MYKTALALLLDADTRYTLPESRFYEPVGAFPAYPYVHG